MWIRVDAFLPQSTTPSTTLNYFTDRIDDGRPLFSLGRKTGAISLPVDKSVSRQHCQVECIKKGRNDIERRAIRENPFGVCLVVKNVGKSGTFVAELPIGTPGSNPHGTGQDTMDSDATDDEGGITQKSSQAAPLGDGQVFEDLGPSDVTKEYWGKLSVQVKLVKVDVDQSRLLDFDEPRSIMLQVGTHGSTIKLTWIPFRVSFSKMAPEKEHIREKLAKIGALEDVTINAETTHLVAQNVSAKAKPLTACCRGIPIVVAEYLQALLDHEVPAAPLPNVADFLAPYDDALSLLKKSPANSKLMRGYTLCLLENKLPTDMISLVNASGATILRLYELKNNTQRSKRVEEAMTLSPSNTYLQFPSKKKIFKQLSSMGVFVIKGPETWAKAIYRQDPQLKDTSGKLIPLPSTESPDLRSKRVPSPRKESVIEEDDSDTDDEIPPTMTSKSQLQTQEESKARESQRPKLNTSKFEIEDSFPPKSVQKPVCKVGRKRRMANDEDGDEGDDIDPSMTDLDGPKKRRRRRNETELQGGARESSLISNAQKWNEASVAMSAVVDSFEKETTTLDEDSGFPMEDSGGGDDDADDPVQTEEPELHLSQPPPEVNAVPNRNISPLPPVGVDGWLSTAPKDDSARAELRKKASKLFAEEAGEHLPPPAASSTGVNIVPPSSRKSQDNTFAPLVGRRRSGPDFRRFRKNTVPRKVDPTEYIPMVVVQAREDEMQQRLEENQRILDAEQKRADELFHDLNTAATGTRRRRR